MTREERARQVLAIRTLTAAQMEDLVPVVADLILAVERETLDRTRPTNNCPVCAALGDQIQDLRAALSRLKQTITSVTPTETIQ